MNAMKIGMVVVAAAVLAGTFGALAAPAAARTIVTPEPFVSSPRAASRISHLLSSVCITTTRTVLIFLRAIPEYVWAFLWIAMFGFTAWPAVLALALSGCRSPPATPSSPTLPRHS